MNRIRSCSGSRNEYLHNRHLGLEPGADHAGCFLSSPLFLAVAAVVYVEHLDALLAYSTPSGCVSLILYPAAFTLTCSQPVYILTTCIVVVHSVHIRCGSSWWRLCLIPVTCNTLSFLVQHSTTSSLVNCSVGTARTH